MPCACLNSLFFSWFTISTTILSFRQPLIAWPSFEILAVHSVCNPILHCVRNWLNGCRHCFWDREGEPNSFSLVPVSGKDIPALHPSKTKVNWTGDFTSSISVNIVGLEYHTFAAFVHESVRHFRRQKNLCSEYTYRCVQECRYHNHYILLLSYRLRVRSWRFASLECVGTAHDV